MYKHFSTFLLSCLLAFSVMAVEKDYHICADGQFSDTLCPSSYDATKKANKQRDNIIGLWLSDEKRYQLKRNGELIIHSEMPDGSTTWRIGRWSLPQQDMVRFEYTNYGKSSKIVPQNNFSLKMYHQEEGAIKWLDSDTFLVQLYNGAGKDWTRFEKQSDTVK